MGTGEVLSPLKEGDVSCPLSCAPDENSPDKLSCLLSKNEGADTLSSGPWQAHSVQSAKRRATVELIAFLPYIVVIFFIKSDPFKSRGGIVRDNPSSSLSLYRRSSAFTRALAIFLTCSLI